MYAPAQDRRPLGRVARSSLSVMTCSELSTSISTAGSMNARARAVCDVRLPKYTK
jgi:hypothetical protein